MNERVLVIDDHPLFREGLLPLLAELLPAAETVEADDAEAGLEILARDAATVRLLIIDRHLPRMSGLAAIPRFRALLPETPIVMITADEQTADARAALAAGALGFLPKSSKPTVIRNALRLVLDGAPYLPPQFLAELPRAKSETGSASVDEHGLTQRQRQVLERLCAGRSNKEIARELNLAENTVKVHISAIFRVLGVVSRTRAILAARERNLV